MPSTDQDTAVPADSGFTDLYEIREDFYRDPHAVIKELRQSGPVHRVRLPNDLHAWLVVGAEAIRDLLSDQTMRSGPRYIGVEEEDGGGNSTLGMLTCDDPRHGQLRNLVAADFRPKEIAALEPRIEQIADDLLDELVGEVEEIDLIEKFAYRLPLEVIIEMLGVPTVDRAAFRKWTNETVVDGDDSAAIRAARVHLEEVLRTTLRDGDGSSLVERIAHAKGVDGAAPVSFDELVSMTYLLLIAGHESSTNLIANTLVTILGSAELTDQACAGTLSFEDVVEESLRFDPPLMLSTSRITTCPVSVGGKTIPDGEMVFLSWAAAERDVALMDNPDEFDPHRKRSRTLAFGGGAHYCLGAKLARLEAVVALRALFHRFPSVQVVRPPQRWRSTVTRGIENLFVRL
ncbi:MULTISPECIES: cytochrome P450 [Saccharothrix]|uniref:cytochrome P450 n=1 Tax=Saccharothrix TaxID=2071 RepID=UPI000938BEA9|nr:cytochrome P450 [Saccharothrix sp. CB00851]OKI17520.1 hypothetical protein A6A25_40705 [Saccharothrix sp. CB00851]